MDQRTIQWAKRHLQKRAAEDPEFRQRLLSDSHAALKEAFGEALPPEYTFYVLEDTGSDLYLILDPPPPNRDSTVTLREVTKDNVRAICALEVKPEQKNFVAPNSISIAEAHFSETVWFRAIYADESPVGFAMLMDDPVKPLYYLWRYMVDGEYQRFGFGKKALELVIDYVRTRPGATEFSLSYVPGEGSPREFYQRLGFEDTGEVHGGENEMKLVL